MGKTISFKLSDQEVEMLEIYKKSDYRKSNPDAFRALLAKGYSRIKKDRRAECKRELIEKGILHDKDKIL